MARVDIDDGAVDSLLDDIWPRDLERRAYNVENTAKRLLSMHGTGRTYTTRFWRDREGRLRRGGRRIPHQASAPGRPPAPDTGQLRASVGHTIVGAGQHAYADIGSGLDHALFTELGTRYMAARPWLRPALRAAGDATGLINDRGEEMF